MTCIVGIEDGQKVIIGGDSRMVSGWTAQPICGGKLWKSGEAIMGLSGSPRMLQLLRHQLEIPKRETGMSVEAYMVGPFMDAVRLLLRDTGHVKVENEVQETGSQFLVGIRGKLFAVAQDFQAQRYADGFAAIGSGRGPALGALHATSEGEWSGEDRVRIALEAAARFDIGVSAPFDYLEAWA